MKWYSSPLILALGLSLAGPAAAQATCSPTGFWVDNINLSAAQINPVGTVSSAVDATGCNIGIYYDHTGSGGTVSADVSNSNYFGILVNGTGGAIAVNVTGSAVHDIGEIPQNGTQHGNAIFYINGGTATGAGADDSRSCAAGSATGTVSGNTVSAYQKNGIVAKCPGVSVTFSSNIVTGAGAVDFIAQNGIELGLGAAGTVKTNTVSENEYTGTNDADSSGILIFGGADNGGALTVGLQVVNNKLSDNDIGVFLANSPTPPATSNKVTNNEVTNADSSNVSGCGSYCSDNHNMPCINDGQC